MQRFKIVVSYDGTDFNGWQIQPNATTVTATLQQTFAKVFNENITILGASRTDTGVHALHQVAIFKSDLKIQESQILKAWNGQLPHSILIRKLQKGSDQFHPCVNVLQKTYYYHLFLKRPLPFVARFGWHYDFIDMVDWKKFENCLQLYVGKHDFASFCKVDQSDPKNTVRTIDAITIKTIKRFGVVQISVKAKSFVRFQIRRMIGYALDVSRRKDCTHNDLKHILDNPNPKQTLLKAPGCGLLLRKIRYKDG